MTAVDYSFSRPSIESLKAAGATAVGRYVGPSGWGKTITQAEYDALVAAGIEVFLVFEENADDASGGYNAGVTNAQLAAQWVPQGYTLPVWAAADTDYQPGPPLDTANEYVHGFSTVFGPSRTGVYGEGALIDAAKASGWALAGGWQSSSSSFPGNATTSPNTSVQQGFDGPVPGTDADTIVRPLIGSPIPTPSSPSEGSVYMIPSNCTDDGAIRAQIREWWDDRRSDSMTQANEDILVFFYHLPANQVAWGKNGFGGSPDLLEAQIIDDASAKGTLRPDSVGSV